MALENRAHAGASWEAVCRERERLRRNLRGLDVAPSQTNFVSVASHGNEHDARHVHAKLIERNIYERWFDADRLRDKLRITIGTPEENVAAVAALRQIIGQRGTE